jgi:hypothetical protein
LRKKIFLKYIAVLICPLFSLQANESSAEIRAAYFYSTDSRFRDIYSGAGLYSIETNIQILKKPLLWTSLGFLYASGKSIGENDRTKLYVLRFDLGIKYPFHWNCIRPYLGIGIASVPFSRIHNDSPFVSRHQYGWGIGGIIKSGLMFNIKKCVLLDCFLDYTYLNMNFDHTNKVIIKRRGNLSGISAGLA